MESGSHSTLIKGEGKYARLWASQADEDIWVFKKIINKLLIIEISRNKLERKMTGTFLVYFFRKSIGG